MGGVCFFNTAKAWGGGEKWHLEVSTYLYNKGCPIFVVAHEESVLLQKLKNAKIPSRGIKISNLSFLNPLKRNLVYELLRQHGFDTIVMNLSSDVKIAGVMAKKAGIPRIIYRRGSAIPIKNTFLNRYLFKHVLTDILANSHATKKTVLQHNPLLFPNEKITVIHNGISTSYKVGLPTSTKEQVPVLLNLGRLEYQKNQEFLILLAAALKQRKVPFKMCIGGEGSLRAKLEQDVRFHDLEKEVTLSGFVKKPLDYIAQASIFLLPSHWEGFGYVLAEAALCKKPIVAFAISSNPELVLDGETGYLVPNRDLNAFADKVSLLLKDEKLRQQMGKKGRQHVLQNFDEDKQLQKIEDYLIDGH